MSKEVGKLNPIGVKLGLRDAFHVPGILVSSFDERLQPGQRVYFTDPLCERVTADKDKSFFYTPIKDEDEDGGYNRIDRTEFDAVVDPFLPCHVNAKDRFWVFAMPAKVKEFRHTFEIEGGTPLLDIEAAKVDNCWKCYS